MSKIFRIDSLLKIIGLTAVVFAAAFLSPISAEAAVSVTAATGGTNISADKAANAISPAWTTLGNIVIASNSTNDIAKLQTNATLILTAPSGWSFNPGVGSGFVSGAEITFNSISITSSTITFTYTRSSKNSSDATLTISGIQVRSANGSVLPNSGSILRTAANPGTALINGITNDVTNFGSLSQVVGVKNKLSFTTQPSSSAFINTDFVTKPVVKVQDQFGNTVSSDNSSAIFRTAVLSTQSCGGTAGSGILLSTPANGAAVTAGVMTYTAMQYSFGESIKICASSSGVASALSNAITVNNPVPITTSISPTSKTVSDAQFTLTVNGANFIANSVVKFAGASKTTTYVSASQLTAIIPASDLLTAGTFEITVFNPTPGGGTSNAQTFTVNKINTTTGLVSSSNPSTYGNSIIFTATVTPASGGAPSGTVTFKDGATILGTGTLNGANPGVTTYAATTLNVINSPHSITAVYEGDSTRSISASSAVSQVITQKTLTVSGITANNKEYDRLTTATINTLSASLVGVISPDSVLLSVAGATGSFSDKLVGTGKTVTISGLTISGTHSGNYLLTQPTTTADITAKGIAVIGITADDKDYDGNTDAVINTDSASLVGVISGDIVTLNSASATGSFDTAEVGVDKLVTISGLSLSGTDGANYSLTQPTTTATIKNPIPTTTSISPSSATEGDPGFIMTVYGTKFLPNSVVRFAGVDRVTTHINSTQLTAVILASDIAVAGDYDVSVFNPTPGGGTSNAQTFTVNNPVPATTSISPTSKTLSDPEFTLTVNGANFISSSVVKFAGASKTTTYVSASQLTAIIPASDLLTAGTFEITVFNPTPGGGTSNAQTFTVNNPVPTTTSISPTSKTVGDAEFTMAVNGANFLSSSVVNFNGSARSTTFINSTQLNAAILTSDLAIATTSALITVFNPTPGGDTSNAQTFVVNAEITNPIPTTTSISPTSVTVGGPEFTLTVNGANFIADSTVEFSGSLRATVFVSSIQLTASIPASDISSIGNFEITVVNPLPGGGASNAQTLSVVAAADTTTPVVTAFSVPATSSSVFVPITAFTATDNIGVTGYLITESSSVPSVNDQNWSVTVPTSFNVVTQGSKILYAWAKDAAGNISSSLSAPVAVTFVEVLLADIQNLVAAGTIVPVGSINSTDQITFNQEVHIDFSGNTTIVIPFGATMNTASGADFSQLTGTTNVSTADLSSDYIAVGAISFGLPSTSLTTSQPVTINIATDTAYNGQSMDVFKKEIDGSVWTQITTCTVSNGICSFTSSGFSSFVLGKPILAPAAITNLTASNPTTSSAALTWTAPGNIGNNGTAMLYDLRYSTSNITSANFAAATQVSGMPAPLVAGTQQSKVVSGLSANTTYYFAIKTSNVIGYTSAISNIAQVATLAITPSVSAGAGPLVAPTQVTFTGRAYPNGKVKVYRRSLIEGVFKNEYLPNNDMISDSAGSFSGSFTGLLQANYLFALESIDKNSKSGGLSAYTVDLVSTDKLIVENIFMPPTINLDSASITKGKDIVVSGYAAPGSSIEIKVDGVLDHRTAASADGYYKLSINTQRFGAKDHFIIARQVDAEGVRSDYSSMKNFVVSTLAYPRADLNSDGSVDIKDWSMFLSRWDSASNDLRVTLDMDGNGKIDIADLSIFLKALKGE